MLRHADESTFLEQPHQELDNLYLLDQSCQVRALVLRGIGPSDEHQHIDALINHALTERLLEVARYVPGQVRGHLQQAER
ncbi:hypothetical protein D3C77_570110 [compost metagenome]